MCFRREGLGGTCFWAGPPLQLGFDAPWERGLAVLVQDYIGNEAVDVFRVDEEAVHVEEAGSDGGEAIGFTISWRGMDLI